MFSEAAYLAEQREWLAQQFEAIPSHVKVLRPSEWAEQHRYLPPSVTPLPGRYSFSLTPYLREIVDCLSVDSPIREVSVMKGSQLGFTVGVLENFFGYIIEHVRTSPVMLVTSNDAVAKNRMESYVIPMLQHSGLMNLIKSNEGDKRKSGKREGKLEWEGGGFALAQGAQSDDKARSQSIRFLLLDESDSYPSNGAEGDMLGRLRARTDFYETSRKILDISTPLILGQSNIHDSFKRGDQRKYWVCCLKCGFPQVLKFRHFDADTGVRSGLVWDMPSGRLDPGSVRYLCQNPGCLHPHINEDKVRLLSPDHGAEWRPSATALNPAHRSYHLSALYAPPGTRSWEAVARKWLDAWDDTTDRPRDVDSLQVFYNNELGEPFELRGEKLKLEQVSPHRRHWYRFGEIPNKIAIEHLGGPAYLLTCAVDVHKDNLAVGVFAWCRDKRAVLVNYWRLTGDTEHTDDPGTWGALKKIIEQQEWTADDGKKYVLSVTLIDSGYRTDQVLEFCASLAGLSVYPVKGHHDDGGRQTIKPFNQFKTGSTLGYTITVDYYKERWSAALRRGWDGMGFQPAPHFNAPIDTTDEQLKELTTETKVEKVDPTTRQRVGWMWRRVGGAPNELWDLLVYNSAALDLTAHNLCIETLGLQSINWPAFWDYCEHRPFYT
jgi:phage terminase large subunit GpA-like protein